MTINGSTSPLPRRSRQLFGRRNRQRLMLEALETRRVLATLISGQVVDDLAGDGMIDVGDPGQSGVTVYVDANANNLLDTVGDVIEPDDFADDAVIDGSPLGVSFTVADDDNQPLDGAATIVAKEDEFASTGSRVFARDVSYYNHSSRLRIDFDSPVSSLQLNFTGAEPISWATGVLEAYSADGTLVGTYETGQLLRHEYETMTVVSTEANIAYATAYTKLAQVRGRLDSLRINSVGSELWTRTNGEGDYTLSVPEGGTYLVKEIVPDGFEKTVPEASGQEVAIETGQTVNDVSFANKSTTPSGWQNPVNPLDVTGDGQVVPLDALLIINELNAPQYSDPVTGKLPPPPDEVPAFIDVDGDGFASPNDAIQVINFLNSNARATASAEGESNDSAISAAVQRPATTTSTEVDQPASQHASQSLANGTTRRLQIEPQATESLFAEDDLRDLFSAALAAADD